MIVLLHAAISDARRQLAEDRSAIICIGDFPLRAEQLFEPAIARCDLPTHIRALLLWDGNTIKPYAREEDAAFLHELLRVEH
jgi:hypothetical protein